jgi:hypothetical protein
MADLTGMMQAAAGVGGAGGDQGGKYIAIAHQTTPYFTLLDHTTPGTVTLATTYAIGAASRNVKFSPDGNYIAVANTGITLLSFSAGSVSLATTYNAGTGGGLSYTPDGNYLASGTSSLGLTLLNSSTPGSLSLATTYSSGSIDNAEFSSDGNYLAISTTGQTNLRLLNHTTPGSLSFATSYNFDPSETNDGSPYGNYSVHFSADSNYVAVALGLSRATTFNLLNHTTPGSLSLQSTYTLSGSSASRAVRFSPDNSYIAVARGSVLTLLSYSAGSYSFATTYNILQTIIALDWSPDGNYISVMRFNSPYFTLLDHTTPGTLALAATYATSGGPVSTLCGVSFNPA